MHLLKTTYVIIKQLHSASFFIKILKCFFDSFMPAKQKKDQSSAHKDGYVISWDSNKPMDCNVRAWRRCQVKRFMVGYPNQSKPKQILKWINAQEPNP